MIDVCSLEKKPLLTAEEALQRISNALHSQQDSEIISLQQALGRVLAAPVYSPIDLPQHRNAAMDGYAFASFEDISKPLTVVGTAWAGKPFTGELQAGQCVRIFTGAVLPERADSVIMQEQVQRTAQQVMFPAQTKTLQNVRAIAEDVAQGSLLCAAAKKLTAIDLALLASAGIANISVYRQLRIAVFSTGDELIPLGQALAIGQIYDSNRYLLLALLHDACYQVTDMGMINDDKSALTKAFTEAAQRHDVLISTGGASVGEADYIKQVLSECGEVSFWKLAIKPGKPLAFGKIADCYFFGLPGNPVSAQVTFQKFVVPALQQLSGTAITKPLQLSAICTSHLKKSVGRQEFQRGILTQNETGELFVKSIGKQGSNLLKALSLANCYIVLASECAGVAEGDQVMVELFA